MFRQNTGNLCQVCAKEQKKYLCPSCKTIAFCSVNCFVNHKDFCERSAVKTAEGTNAASGGRKRVQESSETDSTNKIPVEKLRLLSESKEIQEQLKNEDLRNLLVAIDCCDDPNELLDKAILSLYFQKFAETCLNIVHPEGETAVESQQRNVEPLSDKEVMEVFKELAN